MVQDDRLNRRRFIGAGGAALAVAAAPAWRLSGNPQLPYRVLYDERYEAGRAFAAEALQRSWVTRAIRGDITTVWFRELAPRWQIGPAPVVGVTTAQTLFVLERLAWDAGMRVTSRSAIAATPLVRWTIGVPPSREQRS